MKKIIVFILCLTASVFTLMFSVSAADPTFGSLAAPIPDMGQIHLFGDQDHGLGEHHDGWYESKYEGVANNTDVARVKLTYTKNGSTVSVTYPTYYILKNDSTLTWDFTKVSEYLGVELGVGNVSEIEIPYGITAIPEKCFVLPGAFDDTVTSEHPKGHVATPNTALKYVFLSNTVLKIYDFAFAHCTSLATFASNVSAEGATGDHNHQMLQTIGYRAFHDCAKLTDFNFNNHLITLGEGCFQGCSLSVIDLSKCVELTAIPNYCFHEADGTIEKIILPLSITHLGDNAFTGAHAEFIFLGNSLEYVGHNAINMDNISILILPASIKTVYKDSFKFGNKGYQPYIVGATSKTDVEDLFDILKAAGYTGLKQINNPSKVYSDSVAYFAKSNPSFCETYLGGHTISHRSNSITSVVYPEGIGHQGYATGSCGVCQQKLDDQVQLTPIMVAKGYSICTFNGLAAFSNGFEIYHDALEIYERVNGICELGILFMLETSYSEGMDLRGEVPTVGIYFTENELLEEGQISYKAMDFIMTYSKGLVYDVTDAQGNVTTINRGAVEVLISAYMLHTESKAGDMANKSYYLQDTDDICISGFTTDSKYATVSYDSIYGYIKSAGLE